MGQERRQVQHIHLMDRTSILSASEASRMSNKKWKRPVIYTVLENTILISLMDEAASKATV